MSRPYYVLDTGALMAYAQSVDVIGETLVEVADADGTVAVPLVCLLEASSLLEHAEHDYLQMLRQNPAVHVVSPTLHTRQGDDCAMIGGMARHTGRLGAGHAAYVALTGSAAVVTSRADQLRQVLGDGWPIVEV